MVLADVTGSWAGTNGFRMMPADPLVESPATLAVATAAGGHLTTVAYSWAHPDDGPQDGLVVIAAGESPGSLAAWWGDSWHQQPTAMTLTGTAGGAATVELTGEYGGGWAWRIVFEAVEPGRLLMRMDNVVPADQAEPDAPAGPYPVMVTDLRPA
ncbi:hypothetical protein O7598_26125 [Micromonospora sp. WMMC241]|uniref:hypothetical protein n=1 Tax=Micromonospora sp. WMMC241 TaxID=3015159 RepID=UPI0022B67EBF|nr:hypothetical protein [Micromonospora sp. WMMC241]MCZ7439905.1 hypothetical protein [Micromonospora sp. WMMC241]